MVLSVSLERAAESRACSRRANGADVRGEMVKKSENQRKEQMKTRERRLETGMTHGSVAARLKQCLVLIGQSCLNNTLETLMRMVGWCLEG